MTAKRVKKQGRRSSRTSRVVPHGSKRHVQRKQSSQRRAKAGPRTAKQYFAGSPQSQDTWDRVVQVPSEMRARGLSLKRASKQFGLRPDVVLRLARPAFRKLPNGRYAAKDTDRLLRILVVPSKKGLIEIAVNDSREASLVGEYWNAVDRYLRTGDASGLQKLRRKRVRLANGKSVRLITDLNELDRQASAGVLRFESLYGRTA